MSALKTVFSGEMGWKTLTGVVAFVGIALLIFFDKVTVEQAMGLFSMATAGVAFGLRDAIRKG